MLFTVGVLPLVANYSKAKMLLVGCMLGIPAAILFPLMPSMVAAVGGGEVRCVYECVYLSTCVCVCMCTL